jgi:hypothetical protein
MNQINPIYLINYSNCGPVDKNTMSALFACLSRAGGNPLWLGRWIPAFAGMTTSLVAGFLQT